jgi:eukaryotic-like serine/threonine-protein kinase
MALNAPADGGEPFGRYRLIERIGAGGMAVVYRAVAANAPQSVVVIKRVLPTLSRDPVFVKMLVAEARLSSRLNHPGIVRIHELGRVHEEYFLSMEHVDGVDMLRLLNRCVATRTPVPIGVACYVAQKVAAALSYAHDLKDAEGRPLEIVHRDVSPANIMVTFGGQVKLLDFGVAKAAEHVRDDRTRTGTLKGKINYLSPEQAEGLSIDGRSDLFALGIVLHECLTLKRLFRGPSDLVTLRLVRQCEVSPPSHLRPDVPPELDTIVLRMLARDRLQRFGKGDEIAAALAPLTQAHDGSPEKLAELLARVWQPDAPEPLIEDKEETETLELEIAHAPEEPAAAASPSVVEQTGEVARTPLPSRRRHIALVAGGALLLAVAGLIGASVRSHPLLVPPAIIVKTFAVAPPPIAAPPPKSPAARLTIELDVAAAQIWLDGTLVGDGVRRARLAVDRPGKHVLEVAAPRRRPYRREIVVAAGADLDLRITLVRATSAFQRAKVHTNDGDYLVNPFGSKR